MSAPPTKTEDSLLDRIETRRFVGRELLLWLWFETEILEATVTTPAHGAFGLWLEGRLVLTWGKESTVIRGSAPGRHREAKEALLRGKTPERVGLHFAWGDREVSLALTGETLAFAGLSGPKAPEAEAPPDDGGAPKRRPRPRAPDARDVDHLEQEAFFERMRHARDVEALVEALYREFLALRLSSAWERVVAPALRAWVAGDAVDVGAYRAVRARKLPRRGR